MTDYPPAVAAALKHGITYHVDFERSTGYNDDDVRTERPVEECNVVGSEIKKCPGLHRILLDLDHEAALIPSSTPGHSHLYINYGTTWEAYSKILDALADAGVIEDGYRNASQHRGHTALRMPDVKKDGTPVEAPPAVIDAAHLTRQRKFSLDTFGPGARVKGVVAHIRKELDEVEAAPDDLSEWADVIILGFDGALRSGAEPADILAAIVAKQERNESRTWPDWRNASPDQPIEHDRTKDAA